MDRASRPGRRGDGPRFYVYNLQNQRAEKLGPLLQQAFTGRAAPRRRAAGADGRARHAAGHDRLAAARSSRSRRSPTPAGRRSPGQRRRRGAGRQPAVAARAAEGIGIVRNIQVVADKDNNTLLIVATPPEYRSSRPR